MGEVLSQQAIGVLVRAALPRTLRIAEVDLDLGGDGKCLVRRQFVPAVPGQGHHEARGQRPDRLRERLDHAGGVLPRQTG
jgi:hypothetical protein